MIDRRFNIHLAIRIVSANRDSTEWSYGRESFVFYFCFIEFRIRVVDSLGTVVVKMKGKINCDIDS